MKTHNSISNQETNTSIGNVTWQIFFVSVVGLFLEMMLVRWIGTEVRIFAYLQNTVLVACFLGLGLGLFSSRRPVRLRQFLLPLAILLTIMAVPYSRMVLGKASEFLSYIGDFVIWGVVSPDDRFSRIILILLGLLETYLLLFLIVDIFIPLGRLLGRLMDSHPNTICAYSVNVLGSLIGTWLFVFLSYLNQPPFSWFFIFSIFTLILVFLLKQELRVNLALLGGIVVLSWFAGLVPNSMNVVWSPYQKLVVEKLSQTEEAVGQYLVVVNNTGYQIMTNLREDYTSLNPARFSPDLKGLSQYDIPLLLHPNPENYLIVGAGSGNDAAGGVRNGAKNITAVEIDPAIINIGRELHPEQPYNFPNVNIVINDARSFFATTEERFDVISFSLLDSHTTTAMTNARLDHYVYTRESLSRAKGLLSDDGVMVLTFEAQKPYIADRIARVLYETFGEKPIAFRIPTTTYGWGGIMFVAGDLENARRQIEQNQHLSAYIDQLIETYPLDLPMTTQVSTDDWPYIYLESPEIPILFYVLAALVVILFLRSINRWKISNLYVRWGRSHWHFFFLGAAFMLLEVQNISKASVVLGNTWETNAAIVSGVLTMVLLANLVANRFPNLKLDSVYFLLIAITLGLYFIDLTKFAFLPYGFKVVIVGSLTTFPMFFSGIIFVRSFAIADEKDSALGSNMIGSLVGALLQSVTFVVGIKALLLIVAGFYMLSMITRPSQSESYKYKYRTPL